MITANTVAILKAIHENNKITKRELEDIVDISPTAMDNNLAYLKDEGLLDRIGTKGGTWTINYIKPKVSE